MKNLNPRCTCLAACLILSPLAQAGWTTFHGTGPWENGPWSEGVPGASDGAILETGSTATIGRGKVILDSLTVRSALLNVTDASLEVAESLHFGDTVSQIPVFRGTNADVKAREVHFNSMQRNPDGRVDYYQEGGSFKSTHLVEFYGYCASTAIFENVRTTFGGWRLSVGRGCAPSLLTFRNCDVTNGTQNVVMGVWNDATGSICYDNARVWNNVTQGWALGNGNESATEPATVRFKNGSVVESATKFFIGHPQQRDANDPYHRSWGRLVGCDSTWRNTAAGEIHLGSTVRAAGIDGLGSSGELLLTNCTFSSEANIFAGNGSNTIGRMVVVGGSFSAPNVSLGGARGGFGSLELAPDADGKQPVFTRMRDTLWVGAVAGGSGTLIRHNQDLTESPADYSRAKGSHTTIELVNSKLAIPTAFFPNVLSSQEDAGSLSLRMRGGSFTAGGNVLVGNGNNSWTLPNLSTVPGELAFEGTEVKLNGVIAVGRWANRPGRLVLKDATVSTSGNSIYIGYADQCVGYYENNGSKVTAKEICLPFAESKPGLSATGFYKDGDGSETTLTGDFRGGHNGGAYTATIGGVLTADRFFVGMQIGASTGTVRFVEGADVRIKRDNMPLYLGWGGKGNQSTVCLEGGVVTAEAIAPADAAYVTSADEGRLYLDGGVFRAKKDNADWISEKLTGVFVGAGGAIFDSNGFAVTVKAALRHDDRADAPATDGGIVKRGAGTVTLKGALSFTGGLAVEAGTLDLSAATYAETPSVSGNGTLKTPASGLTVTGACAFNPSETLTIDGALVFADGASVSVDATGLEEKRVYTLLKGPVSGHPSVTVVGAKGWLVTVNSDGIRLGPKGFLLTIR